MKNKILVELIVPVLEEKYDVYVPINKKIGNIIIILSKIVNELSGGYFEENEQRAIYDGDTGERYAMDSLVRNTPIRNGSRIILM